MSARELIVGVDIMGEHGADCYICKKEIPAGATNWGFTWGSDGFFPDCASAMYCCGDCSDFWIDPPDRSLKGEGNG